MTGQQNTRINTLQERYRLSSRQAVYDRINGLNIKPVKKGEITSEQLDLLDSLDKFLKDNPNAAIADFPKFAEVEVQPISRLEKVDSEIDDSALRTINWLSDLVEKLVFAQHKPSPLATYRELEEAALLGWILPTATVVELIGATPKGNVFSRGSFVFLRTGKIGRQGGWTVTRTNSLSITEQQQPTDAKNNNADT